MASASTRPFVELFLSLLCFMRVFFNFSLQYCFICHSLFLRYLQFNLSLFKSRTVSFNASFYCQFLIKTCSKL